MTEIVYLPGAREAARDFAANENREPVESVVNHLGHLLELAKTGALVGLTTVPRFHDGSASYSLVGQVGGYTMLGALECVKMHVIDINMDAAVEDD